MTPSNAPFQSWRGYHILVVSPTPTHPQDHGNRKRIYEICNALKSRGAFIHFVHYPAEQDWRHKKPTRFEDEMKACWHSYQVVPPTRPLHTDPIELDHGIDEWADPALEQYISWAVRMQSFDAVIVNYTWLSFCLKSVPPDLFKICDTHDAFGHRRELLGANGVSPEFFHTTPADEALGLARANLVWAIKDKERVYFEEELGLPNCLTMLHADPERDWWQGAPSQDGWLRAGVIGARNNVNRLNLEKFLAQALPVIECYMAPIKIVIAGGCADDFQHLSHPNVEVLGRVANIEDFYRAVDVVTAPMQFSTGLKIKVSEALAAGAPLIAHAHAMEGYPTAEPLHQLHSFAEMALALVKLSFNPAGLPALAKRSRTVGYEIKRRVDQALEQTLQQIMAQQADIICFVVPMSALSESSLLHDHFAAAFEYCTLKSRIVIFVTGEPAKIDKNFFYYIADKTQFYIDPALATQLADTVPDMGVQIRLQDLLETRGFKRAYIMADCEDQILFGTGHLQRAFVRIDAVELAGGQPNALIETLRKTVSVAILGSDTRRAVHWMAAKGIEQVVQIAFLRTGPFESLVQHHVSPAHGGVVIFGDPQTPLVQELVALAAKFAKPSFVINPSDAATLRIFCTPAVRGRTAKSLPALRDAVLAINVAHPSSLTTVLEEALERQGVPVLTLLRNPWASSLHGLESRLLPRSLGALVQTMAQALANDEQMGLLRAAAKSDLIAKANSDAGWNWLWRNMAYLQKAGPEPEGSAGAALFGL